MAEKNMNAKISVEFEETANRQQLSSGDNLPVLFGKIKKFFIDLKAVAFSGSYADLSDKPESLPANGGTADTARQVTSSSSKVRLYEDGEGGNLRLVSPDGNHSMEMDLFNNEQFRMYFQDENGIVVPLNYNFTTKKLNINGDADTVDGKHADDFVQLSDEMIINNIRINADQHKIADINYNWSIWTDGEGGNFELSAPDGSHFMQMDLFSNTDFRMFFGDRTTGKLTFPFFYRFDTGKIELNGTSDIYTVLNKPYVTGILSEQANDSPVTLAFNIFDFTPSKVICQFGNGNAFFANVVTNGFSLTIPAGTTTIHYIAFK